MQEVSALSIAWAEMTGMPEITGRGVLCRVILALQKDLLLGNRVGARAAPVHTWSYGGVELPAGNLLLPVSPEAPN